MQHCEGSIFLDPWVKEVDPVDHRGPQWEHG